MPWNVSGTFLALVCGWYALGHVARLVGVRAWYVADVLVMMYSGNK